jgi:hypothetical protein
MSPALALSARRILLAEAGKLGVPLARSELLRRRARGGPPDALLAAAHELVRHLGAEALAAATAVGTSHADSPAWADVAGTRL